MLPITPKVAGPEPLPAFPVQVQDATDCLDLYDRPSRAANVVTCLAGGTRLVPTRPQADREGLDWADGDWWLLVTTASGETGWVFLAGSPLTWTQY